MYFILSWFMEVHLIRHTPIDFSNKICYGRLDVPLSKNYEDDIIKIKKQLLNKYDIVYSSPIKRCTILAKDLNVSEIIIDERLLEVNFGDWEGLAWDDINKFELNNWMENFVTISPPNGESFNQMYTRVRGFIKMLRNKKYNKILIVTHSGVIRCFLAYMLKFPLKNSFKIPIGFHEHYIFKIESDPLFDSIIKFK
tara:strand:- start:2056 stop:2643 length:588 start_codon:yes stop_codon:yes gene_type:complete